MADEWDNWLKGIVNGRGDIKPSSFKSSLFGQHELPGRIRFINSDGSPTQDYTKLGFSRKKLFSLLQYIKENRLTTGKKELQLSDGTKIYFKEVEGNTRIDVQLPTKKVKEKKEKKRRKRVRMEEKIVPAFIMMDVPIGWGYGEGLKGILVSDDFDPPYTWIPYLNADGETNFDVGSIGTDENGNQIDGGATREIWNLDEDVYNPALAIYNHLDDHKITVNFKSIPRDNLRSTSIAEETDSPLNDDTSTTLEVYGYAIVPRTTYTVKNHIQVEGRKVESGTRSANWRLDDDEQEARGEVVSVDIYDVFWNRMQQHRLSSIGFEFLDRIGFYDWHLPSSPTAPIWVEDYVDHWEERRIEWAMHGGNILGWGYYETSMWDIPGRQSWEGNFGSDWPEQGFDAAYLQEAAPDVPGLYLQPDPDYGSPDWTDLHPTYPNPEGHIHSYGGVYADWPVYWYVMPDSTGNMSELGGTSLTDISYYIYFKQVRYYAEDYWEAITDSGPPWMINLKTHTILCTDHSSQEVYYGEDDAVITYTYSTYDVRSQVSDPHNPFYLYCYHLNAMGRSYASESLYFYNSTTRELAPWEDPDPPRFIYGLRRGFTAGNEEIVERTVPVTEWFIEPASEVYGSAQPKRFFDNTGVNEIDDHQWWNNGEVVAVRRTIIEEGWEDDPQGDIWSTQE